jgi:hypothetical protein
MLLEQLIMAQLIVLEVFGLASDTGTRMKEKQDKNDLSTPQGRPRTLRSQADHGTVDRGSTNRDRIDVARTADRGIARTSYQ